MFWNTMMKKVIIVLALAGSFALGFVVSRRNSQGDKVAVNPWDTLFVRLKDSKDSLSLSELRKSADTHLLREYPSIDLGKFGVGATIYESNSMKVLDIFYYKDIGAAVFILTLDRNGKVTGIEKGVAAE